MTGSGNAEHAERSRDLERLLTFVDAIAAVAITLLILPLVDLAGELQSGDDSVGHLIRTHLGAFWSFFLSFGVIARLWLAQHRIVAPVIAGSRAVVACLMVWSLAIVFLPFPTALLPHSGRDTATKILYMGTIAVTAVCLAALAWTVSRDRSLRDTDAGPSVLHSVAVCVMLVLALVISLTVPRTAYYPLFLLSLSDPLADAAQRLAGRWRAVG